MINYWLLKSEPNTYSIEDLKREKIAIWDGVRNYQARNYLKEMRVFDRAFFYHSNTKIPAIVGLVEIVENQVIDPSQFNPNSPYFDSKSTPQLPRWITVKVSYLETFKNPLSLTQLKETFTGEELGVVKKGNRLSVLPVEMSIAEKILQILA